MGTWFKVAGIKAGIWLTTSIIAIGGIANTLSQPSVMQSLPPQAAMVESIALTTPQQSTANPALILAMVKPNLLPSIIVSAVLLHKPTSSIALSTDATSQPAPKSSAQKTIVQTTPSIVTSSPMASQPIALTAQSFLDATTLSLNERHDGPYEVALSTDLGNGQTVQWNLSQSTVRAAENASEGAAASAIFSSSFNCTPTPLPAVTDDPDQNPIFTQRTTYACTISLTPLSGSDLRTQSKTFNFTAPPGELIVAPPASMDTVLKSSQDDGGFVFDNEDAQPITINNLTIGVSYNDLSTVYGPLILRFVNPATGQSAGDYDLANLPAVSGEQFTYTQSGMSVPISLTIPGNDEKALPVEILGADAMEISSTTPTITITLQGVTTDDNTVKTVINSAVLNWSCIVTSEIYNPNATSGPLVSGQACNVGGN